MDFTYQNIQQKFTNKNYNEQDVFDLEKLSILELDEQSKKINTFIAMINNKNERKTKLGKKFYFLI